MARKIKLSESELTNIIERLVKEHAHAAGFGFGFAPVTEDTEGEETYHYGEDEGHDKKEEMSMMDRVKAIEDHLKHLKKDMSFDEDREDREEKGTNFMESRRRRPVINRPTRRINRRR